jgi:hypothetical protein
MNKKLPTSYREGNPLAVAPTSYFPPAFCLLLNALVLELLAADVTSHCLRDLTLGKGGINGTSNSSHEHS